VFAHGDLQVTHVFVDGDEITGVIDWSEAGHGDALYDLATLTLGHEEHLGDIVAGYSTHVDPDVIRAWWSWRSLVAARWLIEHGFDPSSPGARVRRAEIHDVRLHEPEDRDQRPHQRRQRSRPSAILKSVSHLSARQALRAAAPLPLSEVDITGCIESRPRNEAGERQLTPAEGAFAQAFATSLQQVTPAQRAGLQATAGNIAEAVVEVVLVDLGWSPLYHDDRPSSGGHGVD
jgi:hypothetical protein